jgi:flagellar biosynthesis regulator FlaF
MTPQERTEKLIALMAQHRLNAEQAGEIVGVSAQTVRVWRCINPDRTISDKQLRLLELELAAKGAQ